MQGLEVWAQTNHLQKLTVPYPVVLASASPRRRELLSQVLDRFQIAPADIDESVLPGETAIETGKRLALEKAQAAYALHPSSLVIGADTIVVLADGGLERQLAKPVDRDDAVRMLGELSGRTHTVITGVAIHSPRGICVSHGSSDVTFRQLGLREIEEYVDTGEPMDKAGAYAIQAGGGTFVAHIEGSVSNVIGLPLEILHELLQRF